MLRLRIVLAGSLLSVTTAAAQVSPLSTVTQADNTASALKSPTTARLVGILPGAGHMYAGEVGRGFLYLGGTLGILLAGALVGVTDCLEEGISSVFAPDQPDCGVPPAVTVSLIAAGGLWVWSIVDAGRAARRTNAKRAASVSLVLEPTRIPVALGDDRTAVRLGLRISTR
jgi:hypothetical protein